MLDEKQKIRIHKLVLEIEKKKKLISTKVIQNYIDMRKGEGMTFTFSEIKGKVYEKVYEKDNDKNKEGNLKKQNILLDEVLSADSQMRMGMYVLGGIGVLLTVWIFSWMLSPSEKKDTSKTTSSRTYTKRSVDIVSNSAWDSGVYQVEDYLKRTLKDPDSYQSIEWYKVKKTSTGFKVLHKYRAKNSFGGYVIKTKEFVLDSKGNVISSRNYK